MTNEDAKALIEEVQGMKKLLILQLLAMGYKQKHIAATLGVSDATLSRMLPKGIGKTSPKKAMPASLDNLEL